MSKLTRDRFARLLIACLIMTFVAGCGNTPPPGGTGNTAAKSTEVIPEPGGTAEAAAGEEEQPVAAAPEPTPGVREAPKGRKTVLEVQYPYGGTASETLRQYWDVFEKSHPEIGIRAVYAANDLSTNAKLFTSVAAGNPPDVTWVDGPQVAEFAARGVLEPLNEFIDQSGIQKEDFWEPSWQQTEYQGKVWALTYSSDPNFGFFWNKDIFKEVGLDPEKPPTTIAEMDQYADKIAKVEGNRIERLGLIPWTVYGSANSLFTWGWCFGGEFYDPATQKVTLNHPKVVAALEWMVSYAKKYGAERVSGFQAGFGTGEQNPFYQGKFAMAPFGPWELEGLKQYAPNLNYGITYLPTGPNGAEPKSSWVGGWTVGIPKGAKNKEAAFEFIKWLTTSDEATNIHGQAFTGFPGYKKSPYYERVKADPELKPFYDILVATKHQRPVMPATAFMFGAMQRAVDAAVFGQKTPQKALEDANAETQKELDRILKEGVK